MLGATLLYHLSQSCCARRVPMRSDMASQSMLSRRTNYKAGGAGERRAERRAQSAERNEHVSEAGWRTATLRERGSG